MGHLTGSDPVRRAIGLSDLDCGGNILANSVRGANATCSSCSSRRVWTELREQRVRRGRGFCLQSLLLCGDQRSKSAP